MRLATLCVVVGVLAADFAWLHHIAVGRGSILGFGQDDHGILDLGIIAMLNVLAFGLRRLALSSWDDPFWSGFEIAGLGSVVVNIAFEWALAPNRIIVGILQPYIAHRLSASLPVVMTTHAAVLAAPMLLFASMCGVTSHFVATSWGVPTPRITNPKEAVRSVKWPQVRLATLCFVIFVLAVNFALIRDSNRSGMSYLPLCLLVILNLPTSGLLRRISGRWSSPAEHRVDEQGNHGDTEGE